MANKYYNSLIKRLKSFNKEKLFDLNWASRTLALLLSIIIISIVLCIIFFLTLGLIFQVLEGWPVFLFILLVISTGSLLVGIVSQFIPILRKRILIYVFSNSGKNTLLFSAAIIWFGFGAYKFAAENPAHLEGSLTLIASSLLLFTVAVSSIMSSSGRKQVLSAIGGFFCIILFYAGTYNLIFLKNPMSFLVSTEIVEGAMINPSYSEKMQEYRELNRQIYCATLIENKFKESFILVGLYKNNQDTFINISDKAKLKYEWVKDPPGGDEIHIVIIIDSILTDLSVRSNWIRHPEHEAVDKLYFSKDAEQFLYNTSDLLKIYNNKIKIIQEDIESLLLNRPKWDFLDFCYFSSMIQASSSFGEIIPNSNFSRFITASQAIFGLLYIAFVIIFFKKSGKIGSATIKDTNGREITVDINED